MENSRSGDATSVHLLPAVETEETEGWIFCWKTCRSSGRCLKWKMLFVFNTSFSQAWPQASHRSLQVLITPTVDQLSKPCLSRFPWGDGVTPRISCTSGGLFFPWFFRTEGTKKIDSFWCFLQAKVEVLASERSWSLTVEVGGLDPKVSFQILVWCRLWAKAVDEFWIELFIWFIWFNYWACFNTTHASKKCKDVDLDISTSKLLLRQFAQRKSVAWPLLAGCWCRFCLQTKGWKMSALPIEKSCPDEDSGGTNLRLLHSMSTPSLLLTIMCWSQAKDWMHRFCEVQRRHIGLCKSSSLWVLCGVFLTLLC